MDSDDDLFVVMPSTKTGKEWMNNVYEKLEWDIACDIIIYNEKEFEKELLINSFLSEIVSEVRLFMKHDFKKESSRSFTQASDKFNDADELRKMKKYYLAFFHFQQVTEKALSFFILELKN